MPKVIYRTHEGDTHEVDIQAGRTVMLGATMNGVPGIDADCGGTLSCATCHIYLAPDWLDRVTPMDEVEDDLLENTACERKFNSRLSCQIEVTDDLDGLTVEIPESQF